MQYDVKKIFKALNRKIIAKYDPWLPYDDEYIPENELIQTEQPIHNFDNEVVVEPKKKKVKKKSKKKTKDLVKEDTLPEPEESNDQIDFSIFDYEDMDDVGLTILDRLQEENKELDFLIEKIQPRVSDIEQRLQIEDEKLKVLNDMRSTLNTMQYRQFKDLSNRS